MKITKPKLIEIVKEALGQAASRERREREAMRRLELVVADLDKNIKNLHDEYKIPFLKYLIKNVEMRIKRLAPAVGPTEPEETPEI